MKTEYFMKIGNKYAKQIETLFLICFAYLFVQSFYETTMFTKLNLFLFNNMVATMLIPMFITFFLFAKIFLSGEYTKVQMALAFLTAIVFYLSFSFSQYDFLLDMMLLMLAAKNVSFQKILNCYVVIAGAFLLLTVFFAKIGTIENLVYTFENRIRNSFGIVYPTDFAAHVFFIISAYICIRKKKITYFELAGFGAIVVLLAKFCDTKNSEICILLLVILCTIYKISEPFFEKNKVLNMLKNFAYEVATYALPIGAIIMILLSIVYSDRNVLLTSLNRFSNNRFYLGNIGIVKYGFTLFGQKIPMVGFGGNTDVERIKNYFFLDSSYLMIVLCYGIIMLVWVCIAYILCCKKAKKHADGILLIVFMVMAIHCAEEHHLMDIAYNPFFLYLFADATSAGRKV